jgi:hypothetical protein
LVQVCGKTFLPEPGHTRFCCAPPGHLTTDNPDHIVIFRGRTLRYPPTKQEENH